MKKLLFVLALALGLASRAQAYTPGTLVHAANNAALGALVSTVGTVVRDGYAAPGDAPPVAFTGSSSACSLNAGAGDGGSQVPSSDGKCWIANFGGPRDPRDWGAKCDGSTDDTAAFNAALVSLGMKPGVVEVAAAVVCKISSTVTVGASQWLRGPGEGSFAPSYSIVAGAANISPMFQLNGDGAKITDLAIDATNGGTLTNTSGAAIAMANSSLEHAERLQIHRACIGVDVNGNSPIVDKVDIDMASAAGCPGVRIGALTTGGGTVDPRILNTTIGPNGGSTSSYGQYILDAGGLYETNDDIVGASYGTVIAPGANQDVMWAFFNNTVLGDNSTNSALLANPGASTAVIKGLQFTAIWAASSGGPDIYIDNTNGGIVNGVHFLGARVYGEVGVAGGDGFSLGAASNITIDNSTVCGLPSGTSDITVGSAIAAIDIRGNSLLGQCDDIAQAASNGINLTGSTTALIATSNDFGTGSGAVATQIAGSPSGNSAVRDNIPLASYTPTIASATSITIGNSESYYLSGTTTITTINGGGWNNRIVRFITINGLTFATGGNITHGVTSAAYGTVIATWTGSGWLMTGGN